MSNANSTVCLLHILSPRPTSPESIYCNFLADILLAQTTLLAVVKLRVYQDLRKSCVSLFAGIKGADAHQTVDTSLTLDPEINVPSYSMNIIY